MQYRYFGNTGLQVSVISLGNVINYKPENYETDLKVFRTAIQKGVNFFDTSQIYGGGKCEETLGKILKQLGTERQKLVIATKVWTAQQPALNSNSSTNKKHIMESVKQSLKRLQMDYVDVIYAHSYDFDTSMEEICRSFNDIVQSGSAFYWAVSNWEACKVFEAFQVCEKYNLHKPIATQNQYNLLVRDEVEPTYSKLLEKYKFGLACWSSLAGGFLTGKYLDGIKTEEAGISRLNDPTSLSTNMLKKIYYEPHASEKKINSLRKIQDIAVKLKCKLHHLAIAWIVKKQFVSTAIVGARNQEQLEDTLSSLDIVDKLTPDVMKQIQEIMGNSPELQFNFRNVDFGGKKKQ